MTLDKSYAQRDSGHGGGGTLEIDVRRKDDQAAVTVSDSGKGIPDEIGENLVQRISSDEFVIPHALRKRGKRDKRRKVNISVKES